MPIRKLKPNTNGTRGMSRLINEEITTSTPEKSLLVSLNNSSSPRRRSKKKISCYRFQKR